jgi:hypothetical protein
LILLVEIGEKNTFILKGTPEELAQGMLWEVLDDV